MFDKHQHKENARPTTQAIRARLTDKILLRKGNEALAVEDSAAIKGDRAALANPIAQKKKGTSDEVPCFMSYWRAREDESGHWVETILFS
ncbi:MAG TPA: hypothetical protein VN639_07290 [Azonexus sp.]|nr:hypothetical protein [Azonexus sp.]